ncbi:MAG TPA: fluoride efflux transporter CrcB [Anaerolineae bacterium]|nr:fluoride efflux transporter CrcB [Anaerolineae bacterium]HCC78878.1 fluoride efflux transporter CrcB [Anaerolineae bacterium]HCM97561.1 fluoride efflux transporter CrcB [Anaerolineae bacterium]
MVKLLIIGFGGFIGSVFRYLFGGYVQKLSNSVAFPYGTLAVNLLGCFVFGFLIQLAESRGIFTSETRAFIFIGILGGFTTFSTFSNESVNLLRSGESIAALLSLGAHIAFGLGAIWLGRVLAYVIWR